MKNVFLISLSLLIFIPGGAFAGDATLMVPTGAASFVTKERAYPGSYAAANKSIWVDVDGVRYKGHYASLAQDSSGPASGAKPGTWGRAFLFASSAKTLHCQLDADLPNVRGQCRDADGRKFELQPGVVQQTVAAP